METRKFKHIHLSNLTCEIVAPTNKGYKVLQTEVYKGRRKPKTIITYYNDRDFKEGGLWVEIENLPIEKEILQKSTKEAPNISQLNLFE